MYEMFIKVDGAKEVCEIKTRGICLPKWKKSLILESHKVSTTNCSTFVFFT